MFTIIKKGTNDWIEWMICACTINNQWIESLLERHIYSRGLGKGINMRLSYPYRDITSKGCCRRHRWWGLGFRLDDRVYLFQGVSHPNIRRYGTSVVGWLCLDHSSGVVGWNGFFYPIYYLSFTWFGLLISNRLLTMVSELLLTIFFVVLMFFACERGGSNKARHALLRIKTTL